MLRNQKQLKYLNLYCNEVILSDYYTKHLEKLKIKETYFDVDFDMVQKLMTHILSYSPTNSLQKPVIAYLIHNHGDKSDEVKHANNLFAKIDINNNGSLDRREFIVNCINFYRKNNKPVDEKYLGALFDKIDYDHSKLIGYTELMWMTMV